jgi:hypothetical protein
MTEEDRMNRLTIGLYPVLIIMALFGAAWHVYRIADVDTTALMFVAVAAIVPLLKNVRSFSLGELKVELEGVKKEIREVKSETSEVKSGLHKVESEAEVSKAAALYGVGKPKQLTRIAETKLLPKSEDVDADPNEELFGDKPEDNGRRIDASIEPIESSDSLHRIQLKVQSTDKDRPLTGEVQFYLHPTFQNPTPVVPVDKDGIARLSIVAWGVFTVGAITSDGTKLGINLARVKGGRPDFYLR